MDQPVRITQWGHCDDNYNVHNSSSWKTEDDSNLNVNIFLLVRHVSSILSYVCNYGASPFQQHSERSKVVPSTGKAVSFAQDTVKTMAAKGFVLGKDAVVRAKAYGESHQVPAAAIAKVSKISQGIGLSDKLSAGIEAAKSVDQRYHISGTTRSAVSVTQRTAASAANAVVSSSYFYKGALWLSDALNRASQVAGNLGNRGGKDGY